MNLKNIISEKKGTIVDVRTPSEYLSSHAHHSINIPLNLISSRINEFKEMEKPIVVCCAAGGRSFQAHTFLKSHGIETYDAGSWLNIYEHQ
jgi:rhodanese-related sulfurtransferase